VERCVACEAVVSKGRSVAHPISVGALCLEFRGVIQKKGWARHAAQVATLRPRKRGSAPRWRLLAPSSFRHVFSRQLRPLNLSASIHR
jgi:hypothetical protein